MLHRPSFARQIGLAALVAAALACDTGGTAKPPTDAASGQVPIDAAARDAASIAVDAAASADVAARAEAAASADVAARADAGADLAAPAPRMDAAREAALSIDGAADVARAGADAAVDAVPSSLGDVRPSADALVLLAETAGFYSGDWGAMVLRVEGNVVRGTYTHDQGTLVGAFRDGVLYAWWSEVPSRLPPNDAGECEFRFLRKDGRVYIDGRWRYGTADGWREDWDIGQVDGQPPADLVTRFGDAAAFKAHP
jgi:hypothetical protein